MIAAAIGLTAAYAATAALLLHLNLRLRLPRFVKFAALAAVTGLYFGAWEAQKALLGWATPEPLPEEFRLHWLTVKEPDKAAGEDGFIYFWVRELDAAGLPVGAPRAHRVPWDEATAEQAEAALAQLQDGEPLIGFLSRQTIVVPAEEQQGSAPASRQDGAPGDAERPRFEFRRAPPPALPPKALPPQASGPRSAMLRALASSARGCAIELRGRSPRLDVRQIPYVVPQRLAASLEAGGRSRVGARGEAAGAGFVG